MTNTEDEAQYPIRVVSRRTGLSAHVIRAWERRYGAVEPSRASGGGRLYSEADIARFRLLGRLTHSGHPISRVAALPTDDLLALSRDIPTEPESPAVAHDEASSAASGDLLRSALAAVELMDGSELYRILMRAVVTLPSREFRRGLVLPMLHEVGTLWKSGRLCPAHEHVLSAELSRVLGWLAATIPVPPGAPVAVAVTPSGHRHEFGALLAAVVAAEAGWAVTYLGPDLPARDIATALRTRRASVVLLSVVAEETEERLSTEIRAVRTAVGPEPLIVVGGAGSAAHQAAIEAAGARWLGDLEELRETLGRRPPTGRAP